MSIINHSFSTLDKHMYIDCFNIASISCNGGDASQSQTNPMFTFMPSTHGMDSDAGGRVYTCTSEQRGEQIVVYVQVHKIRTTNKQEEIGERVYEHLLLATCRFSSAAAVCSAHYIIAISQTLAVVASDMSFFVLHKFHQFHH